MADEPASYEQWNQALADHFFGEEMAQRPAYLQVDDDTLPEVAARIGVARDVAVVAFVAVVKGKMARGASRRRAFAWFFRSAARWRRFAKKQPSSPPPCLGLLGMCALAASRMHSEPELGYRSHNYYRRLTELLEVDLGDPPQMPEGVTALWDDLNTWLERNGGAFGLATAVDRGEFHRHTSRPMSQCLLRTADRAKLAHFFRWADCEPGEAVDLAYLRGKLQRWARLTICRLSDQGKAVLLNDHLVQQALEVVQAELEVWDGSSVDAGGRRVVELTLRLVIGLDGGYDLYPPATGEADSALLRTEDGEVTVEKLPDIPWFRPLPREWTARALTEGLAVEGPRVRFVFEPGEVLPLQGRSALGGWVSCRRLRFGERQAVLCRPDLCSVVEKYLRTYAEAGWWRVPAAGAPGPWACFLDVQIVRPVAEGTVPEELDCLMPVVHPGIYLEGGLKLERDAWLCGGAPDVVVAVSPPARVDVLLDGAVVAKLAGGSGVVRLGSMALAAGWHEIQAGGTTRGFALCNASEFEGVQKPVQREWLGHLLRREGVGIVPGGLGVLPVTEPEAVDSWAKEVVIVGPRVWGLGVRSDEDLGRLTVHGGWRRCIVLGRRPGEIREFGVECDVPFHFLRKAGYLEGQVAVQVPFKVQWMITVGSKGRRRLIPVGKPEEAQETVVDEARLPNWVRWASNSYRTSGGRGQWDQVWASYRRVARKVGT